MEKQTGIVLVAALIFILIITILAMSDFESIQLDEKMITNQKTYFKNTQAAEKNLRAAELALQNNKSLPEGVEVTERQTDPCTQTKYYRLVSNNVESTVAIPTKIKEPCQGKKRTLKPGRQSWRQLR